MTYLTAEEAVKRSISHNETADVMTDESESGEAARIASAIADLRKLGLDDYAEENDGSYDAWGTLDGAEWRVTIQDSARMSRYA